MKNATELKIILAEIHLKTMGLTDTLLTLDETIKKLDIDKVLKHQLGKEISDCLELNFQIRQRAEPEQE